MQNEMTKGSGPLTMSGLPKVYEHMETEVHSPAPETPILDAVDMDIDKARIPRA